MGTESASQQAELVSLVNVPEATLVKSVKCPFQPVSWPNWKENRA